MGILSRDGKEGLILGSQCLDRDHGITNGKNFRDDVIERSPLQKRREQRLNYMVGPRSDGKHRA